MSKSRQIYPNAKKLLSPTIFKPLGCNKKVALQIFRETKALDKLFGHIENFATKSAEFVKDGTEKIMRDRALKTEDIKNRIEELMTDEKNESERKKRERERKKSSEEKRKRKMDEDEENNENDAEDFILKNMVNGNPIQNLYDSMFTEQGKKEMDYRNNKLEEMDEMDEERHRRIDSGKARSDDDHSDDDDNNHHSDDEKTKDKIKKKKEKKDKKKEEKGENKEEEEEDGESKDKDSSDDEKDSSALHSIKKEAKFGKWVQKKAKKGEFIIEGNSDIKIKSVIYDPITKQVKIIV